MIHLRNKHFLSKTLPLLLIGFATFFIQLVLFRHTLTTVSPNELTVGLFYFFWLTGMGFGAWLLKKGGVSFKSFALLPGALIGTLILSSGRSLISIPQTSHFSLSQIFILLGLSITLPAVIAGSLVPSLGGTHKRLFIAIEAAGSLLAGLVHTFLPVSTLSSSALLSFIAAPLLVGAALLTLRATVQKRLIAGALMLALSLAGFFISEGITTSHRENLTHVVTSYSHFGTMEIYRDSAGTNHAFMNGELRSRLPGIAPPHRIDLFSILLSNTKGDVTVIDDLPLALSLSRSGHRNVYLLTQDARLYKTFAAVSNVSLPPALKIVEGDVYASLPKTTSLLVIPSNLPSTMKESKYLTPQFFSFAQKRLRGGRLVVGLELPGEHPAVPFLKAASVTRSIMTSIFKHHTLVLEEKSWIIGSESPLPAFTSKALKSSGHLTLAGAVTDPQQLLSQLPAILRGPKRNNKNELLFISLSINPGGVWPATLMAVARGEGTSFFFITPRLILPLFLCLLLLSIFLMRKIRTPDSHEEGFETGVSLFFVGFTAMASQIFLLNSLQWGTGNILTDVGLVSGLFMSTLALSSFRAVLPSRPGANLLLSGVLLLLFTSLLPLLVLFTSGSLLFISLFSALSGLITGSFIPPSFLLLKGHKGALPVIFASDNLGAGAGALLGGALFLPALGATRFFLMLSFILLTVLVARLIPWLKKSKTTSPTAKSYPWPHYSTILFLTTTALLLTSTYGKGEVSTPKISVKEGEEFRSTPFPHYVTRAKNGSRRYRVNSLMQPATKSRKGYAGTIETITTFDEKGGILLVEIGRNKETPSFIKMVKKWVPKFTGLKPEVDIYGQGGVDTISGATMSTAVVRDSVNHARNLVFKHLLNKRVRKGPPARARVPVGTLTVLVILLLFSLISLFFGNKVLRLLVLTTSVFVLGFWLNLMVSAVDFGLLYMNLSPTVITKTVVLIFALVTALLLGPVWCGFVCPLGAAQELVFTVSRCFRALVLRRPSFANIFTSKESSPLKGRLMYGLSFIKYILLALSLLGFSLTMSQRWLSWDPLSYAFGGAPGIHVNGAVLALMFTTSLLLFRPHCRFFCPVGALITLLSLAAPLKRWLPIRLIKECDYGVKSGRDVTCIRCNRCALHKRPKRKRV